MLTIRSGVGIVCAAGLAAAAGVGFMAGRMAPAPVGSAMAVAQPEEMDLEEMMRLYEEKNRTGEHHKWIEKSAGTWDVEMKFWMDPTGDPIESEGTEKNQMMFDGRYLKSEFSGDWMGEPFHGFSLMGYNNAESRYESTWIDNSGTAILFTTGERRGDTLVFEGESKDPVTEQMMKFRHELTLDGPNKRTFTGWHAMGDGPETKAMEITYTKRGGSVNGGGNDGSRSNPSGR